MNRRILPLSRSRVRSAGRFVPLLLGLALAAPVAPSCQRRGAPAGERAGTSSPAVPQMGGTLRIPVGAEPASMNPLFGRRGATFDLWDCFYPSLLTYTPQGAVLPLVQGDLARRWDWSMETRSLSVILRRDRFWEDTSRVRSADVVRSYEAYQAVGKIPAVAAIDSMPDPGLIKVEATNDSTVVLRYRKDFTFWRALPAATWPLLPASKIDRIDPQLLLASSLAREPISAGPFRLVDWRPGYNLWMGANRFAPPGRNPFLRKVSFERCPGADARVLRVVLGSADLVQDVPVFLLTSLVEPRDLVQVRRSGVASVEMIFWNLSTYVPSALREAVSLAIDRQRILDSILTFRDECYGGIAGGLLEPQGPVGADSLLLTAPMPRFDRAAADSLLDALGLAERNAEGQRLRGGLPLTIEILYDQGNEFRERMVTFLEEDLARVGIRLSVVPLDGSMVWRRFRSGLFQTALIGFRPPGLPDLSTLWASWGSCNGGRYADQRTDSLIQQVRGTDSGEEITRLSREIEAQVRRDRPVTFILYREGVDLLSPRVRDFTGSPAQPYGRLEKTWLADTSGTEFPAGIAPPAGQASRSHDSH